jgi:hypothetical protein
MVVDTMPAHFPKVRGMMATRVKGQEARGAIRTTLELPTELWQAAKIRAVEDRTNFRSVALAALEVYLKLRKRGGR